LELVDEGVKVVLGKSSAGECEVGPCRWRILVRFGSHADHDSIGTTAAAGEGPVEIGVLVAVRENVITACGHDLPFENLSVSIVLNLSGYMRAYLIGSHAME